MPVAAIGRELMEGDCSVFFFLKVESLSAHLDLNGSIVPVSYEYLGGCIDDGCKKFRVSENGWLAEIVRLDVHGRHLHMLWFHLLQPRVCGRMV